MLEKRRSVHRRENCPKHVAVCGAIPIVVMIERSRKSALSFLQPKKNLLPKSSWSSVQRNCTYCHSDIYAVHPPEYRACLV